MRRVLSVLLLLTMASSVAAQAAGNLCPGGLCGPGSVLNWVQSDGTTRAISWTVRYSRSPNVCATATGVSTVTVTPAQVGLPLNTAGPLTATLPLAGLGLTDGVWYVNVYATDPTGPSPCNGETSFPFVGSRAATPTGLGAK